MFKYIIFFFALMLIGCATSVSHLSKEDLNSFSRGKMTIVFIDEKKTIHYSVEIYEVLNTTYRNLTTSYKEDWESDNIITEIHTRELAKQGFNVRMFSEIYSRHGLNKVNLMYQQFAKDKKSKTPIKPTLTPEIKKMLRERQIEHFVLIDWTGLTLLIKSQGLPAEKTATFNFKIFNVNSGNLLWQGSSPVNIPVDLKGKDGKIFLEENNLSQYKKSVKQLIHASYTQKEKSFGHLIGLLN